VLKARSRKISLVLILAMLMTMFVGLGTASAATGYSASDVPMVATDKPNDAQRVGSIIMTFDNLPAVQTPVKGANKTHQFIVKLPDNFDIDSATVTVIKPSPLPTDFDVAALTPGGPVSLIGGIPVADNTNQLLIEVYSPTLVSELKLAIDLTTKVPSSAPEAINAMIFGESGSYLLMEQYR
jgi:hypothetical protein